MEFQVSRIKGAPGYDALPVAKVTLYPLEERDYRPFAQNSLCVGQDALHLRMWAFEVSPMEGSELRCVLSLYPGSPDLALCARVWMEGEVRGELALLRNGEKQPETALDLCGAGCLQPYSGEDLQGVFWGATLALPLELVRDLGGEEPSLRPGDLFLGNFYKLCGHPDFAHQGSFFPADFRSNPYGTGSMGPFRVVDY